jgi:hypothetical protein
MSAVVGHYVLTAQVGHPGELSTVELGEFDAATLQDALSETDRLVNEFYDGEVEPFGRSLDFEPDWYAAAYDRRGPSFHLMLVTDSR